MTVQSDDKIAWQMRPNCQAEAILLAQKWQVPEIVVSLLLARGFVPAEIPAFLAPRLRTDMPDPFCLCDMDKAVWRIMQALQGDEQIAIFGDYDVDGGSAAAILYDVLQALDVIPLVHIPDRQEEGYGPNILAFQSLQQQGCTLLITVDCGSTAFAPMAWAADNNLDVIIVDHHLVSEELPPCTALINPHRKDDSSGLQIMTAAGLCFMVAVALVGKLRREGYFSHGRIEPNIMGLLDLAALGTVCDVAPLQGLNRTIVAQGLKVMAECRRPGLKALIEISKITHSPMAWHCGFLLGPRLNAGGRIGRASAGFELLTTNCLHKAEELAQELDAYNQQRQILQEEALQIALVQADIQMQSNTSILVVADDRFHQGIVGIVAARLKEKFNRPCFVIAIEDGIGKGSGRSLEGVDLGLAVRMALQKGILQAGGGHKMAAGLTISADRIDELHVFLSDYLSESVAIALQNQTLWFDMMLPISAVNHSLLQALSLLEPYGAGHGEPLFCLPNIHVVFSKVVGDQHLQLQLQGECGHTIRAIAFRVMDAALGLFLQNSKGPIDIMGYVRSNQWQGNRSVQFVVSDARISQTQDNGMISIDDEKLCV